MNDQPANEKTEQPAVELSQHERDIAAIQRGMDAAAEGRVSTLAEVDVRIREKIGLPPRV